MPLNVPVVLRSSVLPLALLLTALVYLRGWLHLRSAAVSVIPAWRAISFFLGLFLIWTAVGSPVAELDEQSLTIHMIQHLLLMTFAPPLIWLGAPLMPLLHGLPRRFVQMAVAPALRWAPIQGLGRLLGRPLFCWLAATAALVGWHIPAAFTLALNSEAWHGVEHLCFLGAGLLFWWPVVEPWPNVTNQPRWPILLYLFLGTIPCDMLSGFLVFCDRVVYAAYLSAPGHFGMSALEDQQCAGALMWMCISVVYLVPAAILTIQLLGMRHPHPAVMASPGLGTIVAPQGESQKMEASCG